MLKKVAFLVAMVALVGAWSAYAVPPPAQAPYPAGWGMNPTNWSAVSGYWTSGFSMYDPTGAGGFGGAGWVVGWGTPPGTPPFTYVSYAPITLELWIEMYMIQTYQYTSYQWHRLGNAAENITFTIDGTVSSNEGCWILCTADPLWNPNQLTFVHNIGVGDNRNARNIPLSWRGRWGDGFVIGSNVREDWKPLVWADDMLILAEVDACDRWFQFEGSFSLLYHEADGYYYCELAGCPAPTL